MIVTACAAADLPPAGVSTGVGNTGGAVVPPEDSLVLAGGDTLVLSGLPEALGLAQERLLGRH